MKKLEIILKPMFIEGEKIKNFLLKSAGTVLIKSNDFENFFADYEIVHKDKKCYLYLNDDKYELVSKALLNNYTCSYTNTNKKVLSGEIYELKKIEFGDKNES